MSSIFGHVTGERVRLSYEKRREEEKKRRLERERKQNEKRAQEVDTLSKAFARAEGFPIQSLLDFMCRHSTPREFCAVRSLNRELGVSWQSFKGCVKVGLVLSPNAGGFYTDGDSSCDFDSVEEAHAKCPQLSVLFLRQQHLPKATRIPSMGQDELGSLYSTIGFSYRQNDPIWLLDDFAPTSPSPTVCCLVGIGAVDDKLPNLRFENLRALHLEGEILIEHLIIDSELLEDVSVQRNRRVIAIHFAGLRRIKKLKVEKCPALKSLSGRDLEDSLTTFKIKACQNLDLDSCIGLITSTKGCLKELTWSDMFRRDGIYDFQFDKRLDFLKECARNVKKLEVDRFSPRALVLNEKDLVPLQTIFDDAICKSLDSGVLDSLSLRGSSAFTALPFPLNARVKQIDASSCKNLQKFIIVQGSSASITNQAVDLIEDDLSLENLILDDCPKLETPTSLQYLYFLRHLSLQGCTKVSNEVFSFLPQHTLEHLDLTGCTSLGNLSLDTKHEIMSSLSFGCFPNLEWCSLKQSSFIGSDVSFLVDLCPSILYLNLGQLQLNSLSLTSSSLETLLLMNVDLSSKFQVQCPRLQTLWLGNRYRGWPYGNEHYNQGPGSFQHFLRRRMNPSEIIRSEEIHGESLLSVLSSVKTNTPLKIYFCEEFAITFDTERVFALKVEDFCLSGYRESDVCGAAFFYEWNDNKLKDIGNQVANELSRRLRTGIKCDVTIGKGPAPKLMCSPRYRPEPPDAKWHVDYSLVGGGHDGGYSAQCETDWYG